MAQWKGEPSIAAKSGVTRGIDASHEKLVYEVSFPWNGMSRLTGKRVFPPAKGEAWRANFSRVEAGEAQGDYAWTPMGGIYYMHNPGCFGWLVFAGEKEPLSDVSSASLKLLPDDTFQIAEIG